MDSYISEIDALKKEVVRLRNIHSTLLRQNERLEKALSLANKVKNECIKESAMCMERAEDAEWNLALYSDYVQSIDPYVNAEAFSAMGGDGLYYI